MSRSQSGWGSARELSMPICMPFTTSSALLRGARQPALQWKTALASLRSYRLTMLVHSERAMQHDLQANQNLGERDNKQNLLSNDLLRTYWRVLCCWFTLPQALHFGAGSQQLIGCASRIDHAVLQHHNLGGTTQHCTTM